MQVNPKAHSIMRPSHDLVDRAAWYNQTPARKQGATKGPALKLKMAEKSLFAVLLRSPWWISIAVVGVFALASRALLPPQYVVFGMMGGFPFLVIGVIAAVRQWRAPSAAQVQALLARVQVMPWREFAATMESAYQHKGYNVTRLPDGPADLLLHKDGRSTLVACKRWKAANHGAESLRNLAAARRQRDASHSIYVSLTELDSSTQRTATQERIELLSGVPLASLLHGLQALR